MSPVPLVKHSPSNTDYWTGVFFSQNVQIDTLESTLTQKGLTERCTLLRLRCDERWRLSWGWDSAFHLPAACEMTVYAGTPVRDEVADKCKTPKAKLSSHLKGASFSLLCFSLHLVTFIHTHWILFQRGQTSSPVSLCGSLFAVSVVSSGKRAFFCLQKTPVLDRLWFFFSVLIACCNWFHCALHYL